MASSRTETLPLTSVSDRAQVSSPAQQSSSLVTPPASSTGSATSPSASDASSDGLSDLTYNFGQMNLPHPRKWARYFYNAGYSDMDDVVACDLDAVFEELCVPSGIKTKLRDGLQQFQDGTLGQNSMPQGDLDATAPTQKEGVNWWFWGGVAATAVVAAAGGAVVLAAAAAEETAAAATASAFFAPATHWTTGLVLVGDCLDGDTVVTMADRSTKKIKGVKIGDKILSYNKGKLRVKTVGEVKQGSSNTMRQLFLQTPEGKDFTIKATGGHPFYTKDNKWAVISPDDAHFDASKPVKKLEVGDTLVLRGGAGAKLVKIGERLPKQKTYNLIIDGPGTFFVEGILSHSGLPPPK